MGKVAFLFCVHNHQPVGNFSDVVENAYQKACLPFIEILKKFPSMKISMHDSRILGDVLRDLAEKSGERLGIHVNSILRSIIRTEGGGEKHGQERKALK
jgi:hypothetical protein